MPLVLYDDKIAVNPANVAFVERVRSGCRIHFVGGAVVELKTEPFDNVIAEIDAGKSAID